MTITINKISKKWIHKTRDEFREFLIDTEFPDPDRMGQGPVGHGRRRTPAEQHFEPVQVQDHELSSLSTGPYPRAGEGL